MIVRIRGWEPLKKRYEREWDWFLGICDNGEAWTLDAEEPMTLV